VIWFVLGLVAVLEIWRRAVAHKAPGWVVPVMVAVYAAIAAGVGVTWFGLRNAFDTVAEADPGNKASMLATGISHAMYGTVVAIACALVGAALLVWVSVRRAPAA
jgi:hypothetical protein